MEEVWLPVVGAENYYHVSNLGRVKRLVGYRCKEERILVPKKKKRGYLFLAICCYRNKKYKHIHRLVAESFIQNSDNKPFINHKDFDKSNNNSNNLEWCTGQENMDHLNINKPYKRKGRSGADHPKSKRIVQTTLDGKVIKYWDNAIIAAKELNGSPSRIYAVCKNKRGCKTFRGFKWKVV